MSTLYSNACRENKNIKFWGTCSFCHWHKLAKVIIDWHYSFFFFKHLNCLLQQTCCRMGIRSFDLSVTFCVMVSWSLESLSSANGAVGDTGFFCGKRGGTLDGSFPKTKIIPEPPCCRELPIPSLILKQGKIGRTVFYLIGNFTAKQRIFVLNAH